MIVPTHSSMGGHISCGCFSIGTKSNKAKNNAFAVNPNPKGDPNPHVHWSGDRDNTNTAVNTGIETDDLQKVSRQGHKDSYGRWCGIVDEYQDGKHTHRYEYEFGILKKDWLATSDGGFRQVWPIPEPAPPAPANS